jgi:hypothetical protein
MATLLSLLFLIATVKIIDYMHNCYNYIGVTHSFPVVVSCTKKDVGFQFYNFTGVTFEHLETTNCGQLFMPHYSEISLAKTTRAALIFDIGSNITFNNITISNSPTQGFYINRVEGVINITSSASSMQLMRV